MGEVYLGHDTSLDRPVAIKTVRGELARSPDFIARFLREARAQANLVHPHVVQVYFAGEQDGIWFMAMQLVDGGSLQDALDARRTVTWQEAARYMTGVTEGLIEAARLGIVHRDIKPANLLLDRSGEVHLADFGLAMGVGTQDTASRPECASTPRPLGTAPSLPQLTQVGAVMGTLDYMPPEQLKGAPLDARADIYALGATLFHLLTGHPPVQAKNPAEALAALQTGPISVRRHTRALPRAFADVIDRCLARDVADRFPDAESLAQALRRAGPQPTVPASLLVRTLAFALDVAVPVLIVRYTYLRSLGWVGAVFLVAALALGLATLGTTPGLWLMRLRLRTAGDGDVSVGRGLLRALLNVGWVLPLSVFLTALYASRPEASVLGLATVGMGALGLFGSFLALGRERRTLADRLSGTQVLMEVR